MIHPAPLQCPCGAIFFNHAAYPEHRKTCMTPLPAKPKPKPNWGFYQPTSDEL